MSRYEHQRVSVDDMAGIDAPAGIRKAWEGRGWEFGLQIRGPSSTIQFYRRKLAPSGPWEAVGEYMAKANATSP